MYGEVRILKKFEGMGTLHAWESFGDGVHPDIQAVAKGLGGGYVRIIAVPRIHSPNWMIHSRRYSPIGAVLMNRKVANAIRYNRGVWKVLTLFNSLPCYTDSVFAPSTSMGIPTKRTQYLVLGP